MITDAETDFLYLADSLPLIYPSFSPILEETLRDAGVPYAYLPGTRDIWAVDYMPVQVAQGKLIQFVYNPDYLQGSKIRFSIFASWSTKAP